MSTIAVKKIKLGDNVDLSKNFLIEVPSVADGTLTIKREDGTAVLSIAADGTPNLVVPRKTWTPAIAGGTTAGVGTYSAQTGDYWDYGTLVFVRGRIVWSAHTGTGTMNISLPFNADSQVLPLFNVYTSGVNVGADHAPALILASPVSGFPLQVRGLSNVNGGAVSIPGIDTAGDLAFNGWIVKA